jgi:hypothetical protein
MIAGQSVPLPTPGDAISQGLAWAVTQLPIDQLPSEPVLGAALLGMFSAVVGGRIAVGAGVHRVARSVAGRDGYGLPMDVRDHRKVGQLERYGNALSIPRTGSILALGASRSGKTEAAKHIVSQMRADETEPMIVYDHKDDYQDFLDERGTPFDRLSTSGSDVTWNVFREIKDERDADEIARALFASAGEDTYFDRGGRQVFAAILKLLYRDEEDMSNADLIGLFENSDRAEIYELLVEADGLMSAASHLDPESSRSASNVYASIQERVNDVFVGDIAKSGDFSIREYMHDPEGRALVLDYPYREGESTTPLFRLLIDLAAREALDDGDRGSYFVLDEIAQVPALSRLDELVNVGAGRSIQVLVTLQSVAQLREGYGKDAAEAILSGFLSAIILRCGDEASVQFARERIGTQFVERTASVEKATVGSRHRRRQKTIRRETKPSEEHPFAKGEITEWRPGEGVVVRPDSWAHGRIHQK